MNSSNKLRYHLIPVGDKSLVFQILEQSPLIERDAHEFTASNGVVITSCFTPDIIGHSHTPLGHPEVYLRGDAPETDFKIAVFNYDTESERDDDMKQIEAALKEWAEKAPEFQPANSVTTSIDFGNAGTVL